jgi:hypothetical protein
MQTLSSSSFHAETVDIQSFIWSQTISEGRYDFIRQMQRNVLSSLLIKRRVTCSLIIIIIIIIVYMDEMIGGRKEDPHELVSVFKCAPD